MPGPNYQIEQRKPEDLRDDLLRVWRDNLKVRGGVEDKFDSLYRSAPLVPDTVFSLSADGAVVGTVGVLERNFHIGEEDERVALLADLAVDRDHRSLLPALKLVRAGREYALQHHGLVYGWPNAKAEGVFKRARYKELGRSLRYARILRHAKYARRASESGNIPRIVAQAVRRPLVARVVGAAADVGRLARDAGTTARAAAQHKLVWTATDDPRIDALWASARGEYGIVGERSARFLDYRFPAADAYELALLTARGSRLPRAYAVVSRTDQDAQIHDFFGHRDALSPLLSLLLPALYTRGASSASVRYLGSPQVVELLTAHGLEEREASKMIFVSTGDAERASQFETSDNWHLTELDEDA